MAVSDSHPAEGGAVLQHGRHDHAALRGARERGEASDEMAAASALHDLSNLLVPHLRRCSSCPSRGAAVIS